MVAHYVTVTNQKQDEITVLRRLLAHSQDAQAPSIQQPQGEEDQEIEN